MGIDFYNRIVYNVCVEYITLTQGKKAIVDDEDYEWLSKHKWNFHRYPKRRDGKEGLLMHRAIMKPPDGYEVDHINRNTLDNRRSNLRIVSRKQNADNRGMFKNNTSGVKGVSIHKGKYQASYRHNGKLIYIGRYGTIEEAKQAYETTKFHLTNGE